MKPRLMEQSEHKPEAEFIPPAFLPAPVGLRRHRCESKKGG